MSSQRYHFSLFSIFFIIIIMILSFASSDLCYYDDGQLLQHNNNNNNNNNNNIIEQVVGSDQIEAYPSHVGSSEVETGIGLSIISSSRFGSSVRTIYVDSYGARGDGFHDDTQAFDGAWEEACSSATAVTFIVPPGKTYLLKPIRFKGPCKSKVDVQIYGTIEASEKITDYDNDRIHWIVFDSVENLVVEGGGTINGNGKVWWQISCKINKTAPCTKAPTAITFFKCENLIVQHIRIQNAQNVHLQFDTCVNALASHVTVDSPGDSPNTDGIHIKSSQNIQISNCNIGAGDDCISIVSGSKNLMATNIVCGPGHGISIGSLGQGGSEAHVSDITVNGAILSGTSNGVRIKTWQGGSGNVSNIKFQNVAMHNVKYPIIIDQFYCGEPATCKEQPSAVQVSNVMYQNIKGTSATAAAIDINCSKAHPCRDIILQNIDLTRQGGKTANAVCNNVKFQYAGTVIPSCP